MSEIDNLKKEIQNLRKEIWELRDIMQWFMSPGVYREADEYNRLYKVTNDLGSECLFYKDKDNLNNTIKDLQNAHLEKMKNQFKEYHNIQ